MPSGIQDLEAKRYVHAIIGVLAILLVIRIASVAVYEPRNLNRPFYIVMGLVMAHPPGGAPISREILPEWRAAFAAADLHAGEVLTRQCIGCHDLSPQNSNGPGPGLHDVVGRPRASRAGYEYSAAMTARPGSWTPDELFMFLRNPQLFVPWTKMSFGGIESRQDRINLIAYLHANADVSVTGSASP